MILLILMPYRILRNIKRYNIENSHDTLKQTKEIKTNTCIGKKMTE